MCSVLNHPFNLAPISLDPRNNHTAWQMEYHTTGFPNVSGRWWQDVYIATFVNGQSDLHSQNKVQATSTSWEKGFFGCLVALCIAVGQCEAGIMEESVCAPHCTLHQGLGLLQGPIFSHHFLLSVSHLPTVPQMETKLSPHDLVGP